MVAPGQLLALDIERPAAGGRMIARADGQVVLVAGGIPGERLTVRVERISKRVAYAQAVAIERPSGDRRDASTDPLCGGCLYAHIAYPRQLALKSEVVADAFRRIGHLKLPDSVTVASSPEDGYRMRARLHVRGYRLGFFREGTHEICDARATRQLLPATSDTLERLAAALRSLALEDVREIDLAENVDATERVVHLEPTARLDRRSVDQLAGTEGLTGFGPDASVIDRVAIDGQTVALRRHVLAFFQGNRFLLRDLVAHVVGQIPRDATLVDLYAGTGLFAVSAASARAARVIAVEGDRIAAADLRANAASHHVTVHHQAVEAFLAHAEANPAVVIVDPPRTGMSREALDGAIRLRAGTIVYVSCDVATLARDARRIVDAGYAIRRGDAFDLFPNTPHVETVVVFDR